ncbi:hypothetical protein CCR75_003057 [Bremia lactucae]|uniref:ABC transporter domain-containing protein n=1 Tax=Bremia lactucae TaxID=4779 RepID=A0A976IM75_BRELC|nr:hypothetical protein CCR75_003057 [Bremia lactucae]
MAIKQNSSDTDEKQSIDDVVPDLQAPVATYRLPRFGSRRLSSSSSGIDYNRFPRTKSMFPEPMELTKDDLSSADALMAAGVFTMNSTLSNVIEKALGQPIPGLEVRFRNLELSAEVPVIKGGDLEVPTLVNQVSQGFSSLFGQANKLTVEKKILRGITGVVRPGRITLVLGQPGSGKSSFMKVLANRFHMDKTITLKGDIDYSGKDRSSILDELPRYVAYANQIDEHYPRLTVQETFEFAHRCCTGTGIEPWGIEALKNCTPEQHEYAVEVLTAHHKFAPNVTIKKLGLDNCKDTVVGNAMLRGVSGGERKRVTTGEMLFGLKRLQLLDEISTGLDSAATFDICKSMKSAARNFNATVIISLLQPSPEVFELFDDVLLMHEGTIMYHGRREDAVPYFETMGFYCPPRKDVADFLLDFGTDKQKAYATEKNVPYLSEDFATRFQESAMYHDTLKYLETKVDDSIIFADFTPFRQTLREDLTTLLRREMTILSRDTTYLIGRVVMTSVMGLLYGSTYWQIDDSNSQLTLGLLFSVAMFLSMSQSSQVPTFMDARKIFYKQRGANFFRSSAYVLSMSISLSPLSMVETVVFGAITYWFGGYVDEVGRFIVFLVTIFLCQMWFASFFFFLSAASPNLTIAQPMKMVAVLFFMLFGGFLIAKGDIPDYLIWIYWVDPLAWCIRSLSINQYLASKFDVCVYQGIDYCAQYNMTIGEYSLGVFDLQTTTEWIYYGWCYFIVGYSILVFCAYLMLEYKRYESPENVAIVPHDEHDHPDQTAYNSMPTTPKSHQNVIQIHNVDNFEGGYPVIRLPTLPTGRGISVPVTLVFHELWYSVPLPGGSNDEQIDLLQGVSGFALPGTMTALMGSSGVGLIFVSTAFLGIISFNSVMPIAADERTAFYRERASQTYNALWYFIAGTLVEIPYVFISSFLFSIILYPSVGFDGVTTFFYYWIVVSLNALVFVYLGQLLVYAMPSVAIASTVGALLSSIFMLYTGFNPPTGNIPQGYMWVHWISPPTYSIAILVALVFADCSDEKIGCSVISEAPPTIGNMTIKQYVEDTFDMKQDDIWRNAWILIGLVIVFRVLALFSLRYINHLKR